MKWLSYLRRLPVWANVVAVSALIFSALFCALLPLSGGDQVVGEKRQAYAHIERTYEPLGSDTVWHDTECYPLHGFVSCHLYRASSGNEAFAYSRDGTSTTPPIIGGASEGIPNHWKWGFTVGVGTQLFHYDWDINARYQYFNGEETKTVSPVGGRTLIPLKSFVLNGQRVNTARGKSALLLNQLDTDITKRFHFKENVLLNLGVGLRTTWLKNNLRSKYTGGPFLGTNSVDVVQNEKYWGIGPLGSIKARWLFFDNFYLLSEGSTSLEYTTNRSKYDETRSNNASDHIQLSEKRQYVAPTLGLKIGCGLAEYVLCDDAHISIDLSYDAQFYYNRSNSIDVQPFTSPRFTQNINDVTLQGFALSLTVLY